MVVWAGLLPTVKAGSNVSMSPSTATTSVSVGVLDVDAVGVEWDGSQAANNASSTPALRTAPVPYFNTSRRVTEARSACIALRSSRWLRSFRLIVTSPNGPRLQPVALSPVVLQARKPRAPLLVARRIHRSCLAANPASPGRRAALRT